MKRTIILICVVLLVSLLSGCHKWQSEDNNKSLYGSWKASTKDDTRYILGKDKSLYILKLENDGSIWDFDAGTFTFNEQRVIFEIEGNTVIYEYEFFEGAVTLKDDRETIVLNRINDMEVLSGDKVEDGFFLDDDDFILFIDGNKVVGFANSNGIPSNMVEYDFDQKNSIITSIVPDSYTKKPKTFSLIVVDGVLYLSSHESFTRISTTAVSSKDSLMGEWRNSDGRLSFTPTGAFYLYGDISGTYLVNMFGELLLTCNGKEYKPRCLRFGNYLLLYDLSEIAPGNTFGRYGIFCHM